MGSRKFAKKVREFSVILREKPFGFSLKISAFRSAFARETREHLSVQFLMLPREHEEHPFGDVRGVVADLFEVLCDHQHIQRLFAVVRL